MTAEATRLTRTLRTLRSITDTQEPLDQPVHDRTVTNRSLKTEELNTARNTGTESNSHKGFPNVPWQCPREGFVLATTPA